MEDKQSNHFIDELLEGTLARYRSAEPRPGLEERVLANLRAGSRPMPWLRWAWLLAAPAAALAVGAVVFYFAGRHEPHAPAPPVVARAAKPGAVLPPGPTATLPNWRSDLTQRGVAAPLAARGRRRATDAGGAPRLAGARARLRSPAATQVSPVATTALARPEQFPSPTPLSEQEKLLLRYVEEAPKEVLMASQMNGEPVRDLEIRDLDIPPLEVEEPQR